MKLNYKIFFVLLFCLPVIITAQEYLAPLKGNINLIHSNLPEQKNNYLQKTTAAGDTLSLPLFEDFHYAPTSPYPSGKFWTDSSVYVNTGFAIAPLSIGVATFDGLNRKGYPYNLYATEVVSAPADTLTSRFIKLGTDGVKTYFPTDSIGLMFFYQQQGFGENPEVNDSLVLEFYKPLYPVVSGTTTTYGKWFHVWSTRGTNSPTANDSTFKRAHVYIMDTAYLHNNFKFRIRNRATSSGSVDHWHVDYIRLKMNLHKKDSTYDDVTFGYVPRPVLKNYSSMPWWQYDTSDLKHFFYNFIRNNNDTGVGKNVFYRYDFYSSNGTLLYNNPVGANTVKPFITHGWDKDANHKKPAFNYTINPLTDSTHFYFKHYIDQNDLWRFNDTVIQKIEFNNFYAYDDGSAERGYFHNTFGAKDALQYSLNKADTLRALDIYFDPVINGDDVLLSNFRLCVWADNNGQPGTLIRRDSAIKPVYLQFGHNKIPRFFFTSYVPLPAGKFYVGIQQQSQQPLNIGMDLNLNNGVKLFFDVGSNWQQSSVQGSLMIHPVLGPADRALVGINEHEVKLKDHPITVYPNPASDKLYISSQELNNENNYKLELYSLLGNKLLEVPVKNTTTEVNLHEYPAGIYFVSLKENNISVSYQKFIIAR